MATLGSIDTAYPPKPVDVVVEILSPDDQFRRVVRKSRAYASWGVATIVVVDPEGREAWAWDRNSQMLKPAVAIALNNGKVIVMERVFNELDVRLRRFGPTVK
jgi:Uma2 family endonuclease